MKFFRRRKDKKKAKEGLGGGEPDISPKRRSNKNNNSYVGSSNSTPSSPSKSPPNYSQTSARRDPGPAAPLSQQQQQQPLSPSGTPVRTNVAAVATAAAASVPPSPQQQQPPPPPPQVQQQPPQGVAAPSAAAANNNPALQRQMEESNSASIELTRNLVKKFIADIWNRGEVDLIPEVCSPSLRFNGNTGFDRVGHDGLARMVATIRDALDDYHCEIHSMVVEHNKAFCRLRFTGKHTGNLLGYPPTGKVVGWMGATEFTCQNGKILKVWELGDIKTLEEQLIAVDDHPMEEHDEDD